MIEQPSAANQQELIVWVSDASGYSGHFEVDGREITMPHDADLPEIKRRMEGRSIVEIQSFINGYAMLLDNGQILDVEGIWCNDSTADTGIRFWNEAKS